MVYTENGKYISSDDDWNSNSKGEYDGNRGVVSNEGILVPHGIYDSIILLENGLIKVTNKDNTLYGLLDKNGKEIYEGDILLNVNENGVFLQEIGFGGDEREYTEVLNGFKIVNGYALEHDVTFSELKEFTKNIVLKNNIPYENDGIDDFLYDGWWVIGNIYENPELLQGD